MWLWMEASDWSKFLNADLAYLSNSKTILPLVKFWSGHYFNIFFSKNLLLRPIPPILFSGISWKLKQFVWLAIQLWIRVFPFLENTFLSAKCMRQLSKLYFEPFSAILPCFQIIIVNFAFFAWNPFNLPRVVGWYHWNPQNCPKGAFLGGTKNPEFFLKNQLKF